MSELIDSLTDETTGLSEREQYFLDVLFDQAGGDFIKAMDLAGYPKTTPVGEVRRKLRKEIQRASKEFIVSSTPRAAYQLVDVLRDPSAVGAKNTISAAKEILDRGDVNKEETKHEVLDNVIILLPPKLKEEDESD